MAVIDLGTNSIRYDIHELNSRRQLIGLFRDKVMLRLGDQVFLKGELQPQAMERCLASLRDFLFLCDKLGVDEIVAAGTSALRESKNAHLFLKRADQELNLKIKVISGEEEARLILKGIHSFETGVPREFCFVDIGGGSTELGINREKEPPLLASLKLGAARLQQKFFQQKKREQSIEALRKFCKEDLKKIKFNRSFETVYGASGTAKALTKILRKSASNNFFDIKDLKSFTNEIKNYSAKRIREIPGMDEKRADIILPGALLLEEIMSFLGAKRLYRTKHALREGLLREALEVFRWVHSDEKIALSN